MGHKRGVMWSFDIPTEDPRPEGSVRFADPSTSEFPRRINKFNDPHSNGQDRFEQTGIRTHTGDIGPWDTKHPCDTWAAMNRKRGVTDPDDRKA